MEIDEIFAAKKTIKKEDATPQTKPTSKIKKSQLEEDELFNLKKSRKTEDGFKIYTKEELKIGLGGDTEDCPFDCTCCY